MVRTKAKKEVNNPPMILVIMMMGTIVPIKTTVDIITECASDCCEPDHEGPSQAATKHVHSHQAQYVQAHWFS